MLSDSNAVCVLGAGTMGGGIAAHLANIGFEVLLLDETEEAANKGLARAKEARPPHFLTSDAERRISTGNTADNLDRLGEFDWICEAIFENLEAKRALYGELAPQLKSGAFLTTNTSGLEISLLAEAVPVEARERFMGTHFFNPPRYLKLLELIPAATTSPEAVAQMAEFLEDRVARRVVIAKDTPGFIANRFGMWSMFKATHVAESLGLRIEQVDAITGPFIGRPNTGTFRLNDLVGIDIMLDIASNLRERCADDPHIDVLQAPNSIEFLRSRGWIGGKSGQGYYRREGDQLVGLDLKTHAYRELLGHDLPTITDLSAAPLGERLRRTLERKDEVGEYLREYMLPTLRYADYLKEEISHSVQDFDRVMKWGFGWQLGPFETIDAIGADIVGLDAPKFYESGRMRTFDGTYVDTSSDPRYRTWADFEKTEQKNGFSVLDLGDGVTGVCLDSRMGVITPDLLADMLGLLQSGSVRRLVLGSCARLYSAGFDLKWLSDRAAVGEMGKVDDALQLLQETSLALGRIPSVAAMRGQCFGAGLELAMGCGAIVAESEVKPGFPEALVGLIPGGSGTARMRLRSQRDGAGLQRAAEAIVKGRCAENADHARSLQYLGIGDRTVFQADRLLHEARQLAFEIEPVELPEWKPSPPPLSGMIDRMLDQNRSSGNLSDYDVTIGNALKEVFSKATSFDDALAKEREGFIELLEDGLTTARIRHMLETGKPLRN